MHSICESNHLIFHFFKSHFLLFPHTENWFIFFAVLNEIQSCGLASFEYEPKTSIWFIIDGRLLLRSYICQFGEDQKSVSLTAKTASVVCECRFIPIGCVAILTVYFLIVLYNYRILSANFSLTYCTTFSICFLTIDHLVSTMYVTFQQLVIYSTMFNWYATMFCNDSTIFHNFSTMFFY